MKRISALVLITFLLASGSTFADTYKVYDANDAAAYATHNYNRTYGSSSSHNPFHNYDHIAGGNCTNFVSQALIAGFVGSRDTSAVFPQRFNYDIDRNGNGPYRWYFRYDSDRGPAFTGAHKLYEYARQNLPHYKGLHFDPITHDTLDTFMNPKLVKKGDVIFADFDHDGWIDHSMIVTRISRWGYSWYNEIRLTYQGLGDEDRVGVTDVGLGDINEKYNYEALFYVYRPVDYNPNGL